MPKKHKRLLQRIEAAEAKREAASKRPAALHAPCTRMSRFWTRGLSLHRFRRLKRKAEAASS